MTLNYRHATHFIVFAFLFHIAFTCGGQIGRTVIFSNLQKEDGLPSNYIHAVTKDKLGFLWIATNDGLCRYDGPGAIKVFRKDESQDNPSNSLQSDNIRTIFCDSQGALWIGTRFGGLTRFNPSTNQWKTFRHRSNEANSLSNDEILTIYEDAKNRIWVGTENGLNLYNHSTENFTLFPLNSIENGKRIPAKAVLTIYEDQNGWIWAGTWAGGLHLLLQNEAGELIPGQTRHFQTDLNRVSNNIWSFFQDKDGRYWVGTHGGGLLLMQLPNDATNQTNHQNWQAVFHKYYPDNDITTGLLGNDIQTIIQDQFDCLWFGTSYGLYALPKEAQPTLNAQEPVSLNFERFLPDLNDAASMIGENVMGLYEDNQGLIWISTTTGLSQYNWYSNQFETYDLPGEDPNIQHAVNLFIDSAQNIWVGTWTDGLLRFRIQQGQLVQMPGDYKHLVLGQHVTTIYSPDGKRLFIATELGITVLQLNTLKTITYPSPKELRSIIRGLFIKTILVDRDENIWLGIKEGLLKIDPESRAYTMYEPELGDPTTISDNSVNHIIQDRNGAIWVATYNGLNRIGNPSAEKLVFEHFFYNDEHPENGPVSNSIMHLKETDGYMYIGTLSGLCRYNLSDHKFEALNRANHKYWIFSLEEDHNKNLWASTNEGVFTFNPKQNTYRTFDKKDGIKNTTFRLGSSFSDTNNNIYFVYRDGLVSFSPEKLASNTVAPPIYITEIERMTPSGSIIETNFNRKRIKLNHKDYRLVINFAALNYNRADKNSYAYRLVGFENEWSEVKFGAPIVYTNLKPQKYKLEIKAANNDGVWNEEGSSISIIQRPPYWQTWWFRIISFSSLVSIIYLFFVWYTDNIRKHNEQLQTYNEILSKEIANREKTELQLQQYNDELKQSNKDLEQFAYVASHDLKEPIRVVGSFSSLLKRRYNAQLDEKGLSYIGFIEGAVKRMSSLIDSLLIFSSVGRKDSIYSTIDLNLLLQDKLSDLSEVIKHRNASVKIENLPKITGQKEEISIVFFNLIHNAIKFNNQSQPRVIVKAESGHEKYWTFSVTDNGIGIKKEYENKIFDIFNRLHHAREYEGTGIGLSICQRIILRHQGKIWFTSIPNKGTTFYFTIKKYAVDDINTINEDRNAIKVFK